MASPSTYRSPARVTTPARLTTTDTSASHAQPHGHVCPDGVTGTCSAKNPSNHSAPSHAHAHVMTPTRTPTRAATTTHSAMTTSTTATTAASAVVKHGPINAHSTPVKTKASPARHTKSPVRSLCAFHTVAHNERLFDTYLSFNHQHNKTTTTISYTHCEVFIQSMSLSIFSHIYSPTPCYYAMQWHVYGNLGADCGWNSCAARQPLPVSSAHAHLRLHRLP